MAWCEGVVLLSLLLLSVDVSAQQTLSLTVRNETNGLVPAIYYAGQDYNVSRYTESCLQVKLRDRCPSPKKTVVRINGGIRDDYCLLPGCNESIVLTAVLTYHQEANLSLTVTISDNGSKLEAEFSCPAGFKPYLNGTQTSTLVFNNASLISRASAWVPERNAVWRYRVRANCGEVEGTSRQPSTVSSPVSNTPLTSSGPTITSQQENFPRGDPRSESQITIYISGSAAGLFFLILGAVGLFLLKRQRSRRKASVQNEFILRVNTTQPEADTSRESGGQYSTVGINLNVVTHMAHASSNPESLTSRTGNQQIHDDIFSREVTDTYAQVIKPNNKLTPPQNASAFANPTYGSRESFADTINTIKQEDPNSETYANVPSLMRSDSYTNSEQREITSPSMIRLVENDLYGT